MRRVLLFGSSVTEDDAGDIDLAVEIESSNKFRSFFGLKAYLENALQKEVDLGIESSIKPVVRQYITEEIEYCKKLADYGKKWVLIDVSYRTVEDLAKEIIQLVSL